MSRRVWLLACALLAAIVAGCKPGEVASIYGTYVADYPAAREQLTLRPDGTFTQEVTLRPGGHRVTSAGKWQFDAATGFVILPSGYIEVLDALGRGRPDYAQPLAGVVDMPVVACFGRLYIGTGEFVLYAKREPQRIPLAAWFCGRVL